MSEIKEATPTKTRAKTKSSFKQKTCRVLRYNKDFKELDIDFEGYGLKIKDVDECNSNTVVVDYHGEIGTPLFTYKLKK